jgi:CBS domain-containing protein
MTLADLERFLVGAGISGAPVVEAGAVVGVISRSDIVKQVSVGRALAEHLYRDYYRDISGFGEPRPPEQIAEEMMGIELNVGHRLCDMRVKHAMVDNVIAVAPDEPIRSVARQMLDRGIHRVLVLSEGKLIGVITSSDIVRLVATPDV